MADAPSALGTGGVASRFVSSSALEEAKQRREQEWKAAYERIGEEPPKQEDDGTYDPRSLFEKLQENKSKKQEAFEEQLKFKNHFRALDEDEISFLDSMIEDTNEEEREKKRQELAELKGFRAAVHKRVAPAPPPAAAALSLSPPLPTASTSALPPAASNSTSSSTPAAAAPKVATSAPKKGKRKTLPGLVVKKKPAAVSPAAAAAAPAAGVKKGAALAAAPAGGARAGEAEGTSAGSSAAASAGSKRSMEDEAGSAAGTKEAVTPASGAGPAGEGEGAAKKRRVDEGEL